MDPALPEQQISAIKDALYGGRKIEAIKLYRECTGCQLKEAKDAMDKLEAELRVASPDKFKARKSGGCAGVILGLTIALGVLWWTLRS